MARFSFLIMLYLSAEPLLACTVCGTGKEESRLAFIITTGLLTFIPLIMIGSIIYYIYRQVKGRADQEATQKLSV